MNYITNLAYSFPETAANSASLYGTAYGGVSLLIGGAKIWIHLKDLKDIHGLPVKVHDLLPVFGTPKFREQLALAGLVYGVTRHVLQTLLLTKYPAFLNTPKDKKGVRDPASLIKTRSILLIAGSVSLAAACLSLTKLDPSSTIVKSVIWGCSSISLLQILDSYRNYFPTSP